MEDLSDDIVSDCERKRTRALQLIYKKCYPTVQKFIVNNKGSIDDAKDVFQDGIAVLYQNIALRKYEGTSSVDAYFYGICKNLWLQTLKKRYKDDQMMRMVVSDNMEQAGSSNFDSRAVDTLLSNLKPACKEVLIRFYFHNQPIKEIRQALNYTSDQVVKNKKSNCIQHLITILRKKNLSRDFFYQ